jgi:hypothetical protein
MRKVLMLAAMLTLPAPAPAEAGDRHHHRHFAPHPGARIYAPPPFGGFHGRHFAPPRHVHPHPFGHSGGGFVFRFHDGSFGLGSGHRFAPPQFRAPHHGSPGFRFGHFRYVHPWPSAPRHPGTWHDRRFHRHH